MILFGLWIGLILGVSVGVSIPEAKPEVVCFKKNGKESCYEVVKK